MSKVHILLDTDLSSIKRRNQNKIEREQLIMHLCALRFLPFNKISEAVSGLDNIHIQVLITIAEFGNNQAFLTALEKLESIPKIKI